jgi:hypothetical protein
MTEEDTNNPTELGNFISSLVAYPVLAHYLGTHLPADTENVHLRGRRGPDYVSGRILVRYTYEARFHEMDADTTSIDVYPDNVVPLRLALPEGIFVATGVRVYLSNESSGIVKVILIDEDQLEICQVWPELPPPSG